jgi:leucyl aminopeptidase
MALAPTADILCSADPLAELDTELLIVPWAEGASYDILPDLDRATGGELGRALAATEFRGRPYELFLAPLTDVQWKPRRVMLVGAGRSERFGAAEWRRLATVAALQARHRRVSRAALLLQTGAPVNDEQCIALVRAATEGLTLGEFDGAAYRTTEATLGPAPRWTLSIGRLPADVALAVTRSRVLGECSNLARALANEPGNVLSPREFALRAAAVAHAAGVSVDIVDEERIAAMGMGLLLGVAKGSAEPPRVVVLRHDPPGAPDGPVLGLVGKGITFDTGGISIKPADGMDRMKDDMAGGAAVACAMRALATLGAPMRVIGVVPMAENMPGGRALRPGDVLRSAEGKTVEVLNTDAEGRLILGDALWYARSLGATHLVDVATLTGAVVVALGKSVSGIMGTPDAWVQHVRGVGQAVGDEMWPLPLVDDYRDQLKSEIADFSNTGGRPAGSITAALFLREFSGGLPWAHLDIAGTAWSDEARPYLPKGPSGVAVRTLAELAFTDGWPEPTRPPGGGPGNR